MVPAVVGGRGDQRLAGLDPGLDLERGPVRVAQLQRGPDRALRVVLVGQRHPERGHGGAADHGLDDAAEPADLPVDLLQPGREPGPGVLGVDRVRVSSGAQGHDQDGDDLALLPQLQLAAVGGGCGGRRGGRGRGVEPGGPGAHGLLQPLELGTGLDAEVLDEGGPGHPGDVERLGLPARPVQGQHELGLRALAERLLGDQGAQLVEDVGVAAELELGVDPVDAGADAQLLQPGPGDVEDVAGQPAERLAAPQRQRGGEPVRGGLVVPRRHGGARRGQAGLEPGGVQGARRDVQHVAGPPGDQQVAAAGDLGQGPAQLVDQEVQGLPGRGGRRALPEGVDQPVQVDDPVGFQQQHAEQGADAGAADRDHLGAVPDLERAEQPQLEAGRGRGVRGQVGRGHQRST